MKVEYAPPAPQQRPSSFRGTVSLRAAFVYRLVGALNVPKWQGLAPHTRRGFLGKFVEMLRQPFVNVQLVPELSADRYLEGAHGQRWRRNRLNLRDGQCRKRFHCSQSQSRASGANREREAHRTVARLLGTPLRPVDSSTLWTAR